MAGSLRTLENAWRTAAPKIAAISLSLSPHETPKQRVVRVGQLDAVLLDQELAQVLKEPILGAFSLVSHTTKAGIEPELGLVIQLFLYKLSVWDNGGSYGAKLQDLRYFTPQTVNRSLTPSGLPRITLLCHGFLTVLVPYLHSRIRTHALSRAWPDAPSKDRRRIAWDVLTSTESLHTLLGLLNFLAFLWSGRYRTLADRLLRLQLVPSRGQVRRDISYEFMNRQMVWHAFTEFLIFLLPLLHGRSARRRLNKLFSYLSPSKLISIIPVVNRLSASSLQKSPLSGAKRRGKFWSLPVDQCAICAENASLSFNVSETATISGTTLASRASAAENPELPAYPINIPYIASCGDIYCYSCLTERLMGIADDTDKEHGWECLRCTEEVTSANRYEVEITGSGSGSDYELSSEIDLDTTDISGSLGSYRESVLSDDY